MNEKNIRLTKRVHAFKGYANSYNLKILSSFIPELQLKDTESAIKSKLMDLLTQLKGFKFMTTIVLVLKKVKKDDKTEYDTSYSHSKREPIINENDIDDGFKSIYTTIIWNIQESLGKCSGWIIDSVIEHNIYISI